MDAGVKDTEYTLAWLINIHGREMNITRVHRDTHSLRSCEFSQIGGISAEKKAEESEGISPSKHLRDDEDLARKSKK